MEARITCRIRSLQISDLGLSLNKGDVIFIPREKALASSELALAQRSGAVEVTYVQRSQSTNISTSQTGSLQMRRPVKIPSETSRKQEPKMRLPEVPRVLVEQEGSEKEEKGWEGLSSVLPESSNQTPVKKKPGRAPAKQVEKTEEI